MKVLVCGGRNFIGRTLLDSVLDFCHKEYNITCVIQGEARGADSLAKAWAVENKISTKNFPAHWEKFGKKAGYIRNKQMLVEGKPDLVIAFSGGAGTANMIRLAKEANIEVIEVNEEF